MIRFTVEPSMSAVGDDRLARIGGAFGLFLPAGRD
jgi:hypothetical protein